MPRLLVELNDGVFPLEKCDWVMWAPCGCPSGVTVASYGSGAHLRVLASEEDLWLDWYDTAKERRKAREQGFHPELVSHQDYVARISPLMQGPCKHDPQWGIGSKKVPVGQASLY